MSIARNYIYNMIYQVTVLIIPLITVPYISRVLGSSGVGLNAYSYSIISYFILFGTLGISLYGNRSIAYVRDNKEELSRTFWSIFILQFISTSLSYLLFTIFLIFFKSYHFIFLLQSINLISAAIDISWLFMGLEDFKKTVVRNLMVRIIGIISIFIFVREFNDLWKYILIIGVSQFLGSLSMWAYIPRTVNLVRIKWKDIRKHVLPTISLFLPQIAVQIYTVLNKTMLGYLSKPEEVGYFDSADKLVKMILAVVTALGVVMLPRISNVFAKGQMNKVKDYLYKSFDFVSFLAFPAAFGIASVATILTPWFFGPGFQKTGLIIMIISPILVLIAWSGVIGQQFLMPIRHVRIVTLSVCAGAIVNFIMNLLLIQKFQSVGTAFSTLISEIVVTFFQVLWIRKIVDLKKLFYPIWKYFVAGIIMYAVVDIIGVIYMIHIYTTILQVIIGAVVYLVILFILRSEMNTKLFCIVVSQIRRIFSANKEGDGNHD